VSTEAPKTFLTALLPEDVDVAGLTVSGTPMREMNVHTGNGHYERRQVINNLASLLSELAHIKENQVLSYQQSIDTSGFRTVTMTYFPDRFTFT